MVIFDLAWLGALALKSTAGTVRLRSGFLVTNRAPAQLFIRWAGDRRCGQQTELRSHRMHSP